MTEQEKALEEVEAFKWMTSKGYDRKASKDIAQILVKYKEEQLTIHSVSKCKIIKEEIWQIYNKTYRNYIDRPLDDTRIMLSGKHEAFGEVIDIINNHLK